MRYNACFLCMVLDCVTRRLRRTITLFFHPITLAAFTLRDSLSEDAKKWRGESTGDGARGLGGGGGRTRVDMAPHARHASYACTTTQGKKTCWHVYSHPCQCPSHASGQLKFPPLLQLHTQPLLPFHHPEAPQIPNRYPISEPHPFLVLSDSTFAQ